MKSKIKSVQQDGTWNGNDGTLYYRHEYLMEDGALLNASHKTQTPFKEGEEVEYEITKTNQYGNQGKVKKPNEFKKGKNDAEVQLYIVRQSSLNRAIEHLSYKESDMMTKENVVALAEFYTKWVLGNE